MVDLQLFVAIESSFQFGHLHIYSVQKHMK